MRAGEVGDRRSRWRRRAARSGASRSRSLSRTTTFSRPRWRVAGASRRAMPLGEVELEEDRRRHEDRDAVPLQAALRIAEHQDRAERAGRLVEDVLEGRRRGASPRARRRASDCAASASTKIALVAGASSRLRPWKAVDALAAGACARSSKRGEPRRGRCGGGLGVDRRGARRPRGARPGRATKRAVAVGPSGRHQAQREARRAEAPPPRRAATPAARARRQVDAVADGNEAARAPGPAGHSWLSRSPLAPPASKRRRRGAISRGARRRAEHDAAGLGARGGRSRFRPAGR